MKNDNPLVINIKNEIFVVGWFSKNASELSTYGKRVLALTFSLIH
jgi:hypothetical protein